MFILGISGHHRDAAAALLHHGRIVAAIEEEKLCRIKNIGARQSGGLPYQSIKYCLDAAGISIGEIDRVTYYQKPHRLLKKQLAFSETPAPVSAHEREEFKTASVNEYNDRLKTLFLIKHLLANGARVIRIDHQLSHAAGAFYLSGFDRAAVINLNGKGDLVSAAIGLGEGKKIKLLKRLEFPHSIGWVYSLITEYLGFRPQSGENNTQWLSLTGEPEYLSQFQELIKIDEHGMPSIDHSYFQASSFRFDRFSEKFYEKFGDRLRTKDHRFDDGCKPPSWTEMIEGLIQPSGWRPGQTPPADAYRRNLAYSLQLRLEQTVLAMVESVRREFKVDHLCLSGSVAQNSLLISKLEQESGYRQIFVQPAAGNAGCSVGSALYHWHHQLNRAEPAPLEHVFYGPQYSDHEIKPVLDNSKLSYRYFNSEEKMLAEVAELILNGQIVAWFQGRAEFGPRSLGARSILASPLDRFIKDNLNLYVKHRETNRPFAVSIPEEKVGEYFESYSRLSSFLLTVSRIKHEKKEVIPAAWFSNNLARVHSISQKNNQLFWRLHHQFAEISGVPILLNTSFNLFGEPIVCTPREAIRSFYCSGIDALAIQRFLLKK